VHVSIKSGHLSVKYNKKSYLHNWLAINSILFNVKENWNPWVWISLYWQPPFYPDSSLRSNGHARGVPSGKNGSQIWIEEIDITKRLVCSVILYLFIVFRFWKLRVRSVLFNFNFELICYSLNILKLFWSDSAPVCYITGIWMVF
jgi:hypothetical protein